MATLARTAREEQHVDSDVADWLTQTVPSPFPREQLSDTTSRSAVPDAALTRNSSEPILTHPSTHTQTPVATPVTVQTELMPSIASVQKSCIMALNNLLYIPDNWHSIIPDRRHSMPANPSSHVSEQDSSPLQTLISNLRHRDNGEMLEFNADASETELMRELQTRVERISYQLSPPDAQLALALVQLLSNIHRISVLSGPSFPCGSTVRAGPSRQSLDTDMYSVLKRQLSDFQQERLAVQNGSAPTGASPAIVVQTALLWSRVDEELEAVVAMCRERTENLPPQYDIHDSADDLPEYELDSTYKHAIEDSKTLPTVAASLTNEKMRLDLEAITMAIDRLYQVAPQLHNQRVELKSSKIAQMERARSASSTPLSTKGKGKEKLELAELDKMLGLLGKASERKMKDQTVILDGGMEPYLQRAQQRDQAKREAFVDRLAAHSGAGRLHSQDAVLQPTRMRNPDTMLTLPEFIREEMPLSLQSDSALPELNKTVRRKRSKSLFKESGRNRSVSAPSFPWKLKHVRSRSSNLIPGIKSPLPPTPSTFNTGDATLKLHYVAENHDHLQHVLVFITAEGLGPEDTIEAEVPPFTREDTEGECLAINAGEHVYEILTLPARISAGPKSVVAQPGYYEVRLGTLSPRVHSPPPPTPLMDATQLTSLAPTSFICASCSLPLVRAADVKTFRDLPSEHWEELVDAWMCHSDQKLHDTVSRHSQGFWPEAGQALVGGSYLLFEQSNVVQRNVCAVNGNKRADEWHLARCLCGAIIGRSQVLQRSTDQSRTVYRLLKFAIRPVNPKAEPIKTPLSAYVVEDMIEFVQAHATYRFVISDEEEERPRLLIWLFKPSIQLSYSAPTSYAIPKTANIHAAKVLFKILKPSSDSEPIDLKSILDKYPGFPQAEYLFYPLSACRRLASQLKESNGAYPESMRTMTGLDVGWLRRA